MQYILKDKKATAIFLGSIHFICICLFVVGVLMKGHERMMDGLFIAPILLAVLKVGCDFLGVNANKFGKVFRRIVYIMWGLIFIGQIGVNFTNLTYVTDGAGCVVILVGGFLSALSYLIIEGIDGVHYCVHVLFNTGFTGKAPISFPRKVGEVFLQILMLPIALFAQAWALAFLIGGAYVSGAIVKYLIFCAIKKEENEKGDSYNVGASDKLVSKNVTHEIKDNSGQVVGKYETSEYSIEHDNGDRYEVSDQFSDAMVYSLFILPCRIIALLFSVLALFIPKLYVSIRKPKTDYEYDADLFRYVDIIALKNK